VSDASDVIAAIAGGRGIAVWGLRLDLSSLGLDDMLFSTSSYFSAARGQFVGKVKSWGGLTYSVSDRSGSLPGVVTRVMVNDHDRAIQALDSGVHRNRLKGIPVYQYLMTPAVAGDALKVFVGVLVSIGWPEPFVAEIEMKCNDEQLQMLTPNGGWVISRTNWPNALPEHFGKPAPILYGRYDASLFQAAPGLIPTLLVDTVTHRHLISAGVPKSVIRVYVASVVVTTGFSVETLVRPDGRTYTVVKFAAAPAGEVTVDVEGYEAVGDGSGALITNPATQWAHRMSNFVLADWTGGAWLSTHSLVDSASVAANAAIFGLMGAKGRDYDDEMRTGDDVIARFCKSWRWHCGWTLLGTIATARARVEGVQYVGDTWRWHDEMGPFVLDRETFKTPGRILAQQSFSPSQNAYLSSLEVQDPGIAGDVQDAIDFPLVAEQ